MKKKKKKTSWFVFALIQSFLSGFIFSRAGKIDLESNLEDFVAEEYFSARGIRTVTSALCHGNERKVWLGKRLSEKGIGFNWINLELFNESDFVKLFGTKFSRLGMMVDLKCPRSLEFLRSASENNLFSFKHSSTFWLILTGRHLPEDVLKHLADNYYPETTDPVKFLTDPYEENTKEKSLLEVNRKVNEEFLKNFVPSEKASNATEAEAEDESEITSIFKLNIFFDSEVTLGIPGSTYHFYGIYKLTKESKPKVRHEGLVQRNGENRLVLKVANSGKVKNFEGAILRAGSALYQPEAFTSIDDVSTRETDIWPKMTYEHIKVLARDLNFRLIIRFFNDYGWSTNESFSHMLGSFQKRESEVSATAGLVRSDRFAVVDYTSCPFLFHSGLLFREPSLASVENIFLLPFSKGIWISVGGLALLMAIFLRLQSAASKKLLPREAVANCGERDFSEIGISILGAICQQGFSTKPRSLSDRMTILFLLLSSLILFSSYSASIVALLQSSSSAINTIEDITESEFEVGIEDHFPYFKVLLKEANLPVVKEYYRKKIFGKRGKVYFDQREGIQKMRTKLFAFEVESSAAYKTIRETFQEHEKCGIKSIDLIPKPSLCLVVAKHSPYKEVFTQRYVWQEEIGLFDRSWKHWTDPKPECETTRIGFVSVGLKEFHPVLWIFVFGALVSFASFAIEILLGRRKSFRIEFTKSLFSKLR